MLVPLRVRERDTVAIVLTMATFVKSTTLGYLPAYIAKGLGPQLFEHARLRARDAGALRMEWQAEPNDRGFYERMGERYLRNETGLLGTPIEVQGVELGS
jgi:GNAT superfamily N-acetyltransferase